MPPPDAKNGLAPTPDIIKPPITTSTPEATPLVDPRAKAMAAALRGLGAAGTDQSEAGVRSIAAHESGVGGDGGVKDTATTDSGGSGETQVDLSQPIGSEAYVQIMQRYNALSTELSKRNLRNKYPEMGSAPTGMMINAAFPRQDTPESRNAYNQMQKMLDRIEAEIRTSPRVPSDEKDGENGTPVDTSEDDVKPKVATDIPDSGKDAGLAGSSEPETPVEADTGSADVEGEGIDDAGHGSETAPVPGERGPEAAVAGGETGAEPEPGDMNPVDTVDDDEVDAETAPPPDDEPVAPDGGVDRKEAEGDKEKTPREYLAERRVKGNGEMAKLKRNLEMIREMMTEMRIRVDKARMVFALASEVYGASKFDGEINKLEKVDDFLKTLEGAGEDSWEPKIASSEESLQGEMDGLPESRQVADRRGNMRELAVGESPQDDEQMTITVDASDIDRDKKANIASLNEKLREQFGAFFEPAEKKLGTTWLRNSEANTNWNLLNQLDRQARGLAGQMVEEALDTESDLSDDDRAIILAKREELESYEGEGDMGKKWSRWEVGGLVAGALAAYTVIRLTKEGAELGMEDAGIDRKSKGAGGGLSWMQKMKMLSMGFTPEQVMFLDKKSKQDAKVAAEAAKAETAEEVTASTGVAPPTTVPTPVPPPPPPAPVPTT